MPAPPEIQQLERIIVEAYEKASDEWSGQCFCFTSAPESLRRNAHEAARDGFLALYTLLGTIARPILNAEYKAAELEVVAALGAPARTEEKVYPRIKDDSPTFKRVDAAEVAAALGAKEVRVTHDPKHAWRPIETHDGSFGEVLVATEDAVGEARFHVEDGWWWVNNDPTDAWGQRIYPTHWMPLPDPPAGSRSPLAPPSPQEPTR